MSELSNIQYIQLMQMFKKQDDFYHAQATGFGISESAFWVLYALRESDESFCQQQLCEKWNYPKQTVHSAVKSLMTSGYIYLAESKTHHAQKNIILTPRGEEFCQGSVDLLLAAERRAFARLSEAERKRLLVLFDEYIHLVLDEASGIPKTILPHAGAD